jgi:hypothetical protein
MQKNYNRLALQGMQFDDMEFCQEFKLDPSLAYTPELNIAMLNKVYESNVKDFMEQGMSEQAAKSASGKLRAEAKSDIQKLIG